MKNNIIAIIYDFDKTLCTKDMQEYTFIPNLGIDADTFWNDCNLLRDESKIDQVLAYMYLMLDKNNKSHKNLKRKYLNEMGENIEFFPGVVDWFERINKYGKEHGMTIEHYVVSSGLKEIIEGSEIGKYFKVIYASEYLYDDNGNAVWPKIAINYTNKTQFLYRINKGVLDISNDDDLNNKMLKNQRRIDFSNMIYIGDGITDIPCMQMNVDRGGVSIAVYNKNNTVAKKLLDDERINFMAKANYNNESELDMIVKEVINEMAIKTKLDNVTYSQLKG